MSSQQARVCKFEIYQGTNGNWYWRLKDTNGKTIADGAEGYVRKEGALQGVRNVVECCQNDPVYEYV